jgi:hypothetical protein
VIQEVEVYQNKFVADAVLHTVSEAAIDATQMTQHSRRKNT